MDDASDGVGIDDDVHIGEIMILLSTLNGNKKDKKSSVKLPSLLLLMHFIELNNKWRP